MLVDLALRRPYCKPQKGNYTTGVGYEQSLPRRTLGRFSHGAHLHRSRASIARGTRPSRVFQQQAPAMSLFGQSDLPYFVDDISFVMSLIPVAGVALLIAGSWFETKLRKG